MAAFLCLLSSSFPTTSRTRPPGANQRLEFEGCPFAAKLLPSHVGSVQASLATRADFGIFFSILVSISVRCCWVLPVGKYHGVIADASSCMNTLSEPNLAISTGGLCQRILILVSSAALLEGLARLGTCLLHGPVSPACNVLLRSSAAVH